MNWVCELHPIKLSMYSLLHVNHIIKSCCCLSQLGLLIMTNHRWGGLQTGMHFFQFWRMKSKIKALAEVVNGEDLLPGSQTVIVTALERSELSSHEKTWKALKHVTKWKEASVKGSILYDFICDVLIKANYGDSKKTSSDCWGLGTWVSGAQGIFRALKLSCMIL